ncbi:MAG: hypothetical protein OWS74_07825, partial [Firmicutes bacterium]|nr:hypothetical protein [Bacillota bacterium]
HMYAIKNITLPKKQILNSFYGKGRTLAKKLNPWIKKPRPPHDDDDGLCRTLHLTMNNFICILNIALYRF